KIRHFSLGEFNLPPELFAGDADKNPEPKGPYYNYIHDALKRHANIEIFMGDARISMKERTEEILEEKRQEGVFANWKESREGIAYQHRENYYLVMEI